MEILRKRIFGASNSRSELTNHNQQNDEMLLKFGRESPEQAIKTLNSTRYGLTRHEALVRLRDYGKNEVAREKHPAWWTQLFNAFINPFIIILIILAIASFFTDVQMAAPGNGDWTKVVILSIMVSASVLIRFWQEFRSQKAAEKLQALVQNKVLVSRQNIHKASPEAEGDYGSANAQEIPVTELVPGDIVHLSAGDMIPADIRLLWSNELYVNSSALTGESLPVERHAKGEISDTDNPLELETLCFMGSSVVSGIAKGIVINTGNRTYFGSVAKKIVGQKTITSFEKGVNKVSWVLIGFMLVMVPIVFIVNNVTKHDWHEALFFALAVAVGLTPEMLPLVVTANLAKGSLKMSKQKVIVKKLNAIQNFGAMDVLCMDKTGTITENRVVLIRHLDQQGRKSEKVLRLAYLNSHFQAGLRNLIDKAIIERKEKMDSVEEESKYTKIDEIPFDFNRRRMSVIVKKDDEETILICKGALEEVLSICTNVEQDGKIVPINESSEAHAKDMTKDMNKDGLRVIAVAYKKLAEEKSNYTVKDENELTLVGYVGFLDPPKASAKEAIKHLEHHGISVKIITGDNEIVTARICKDVGLNGSKALLGNEIESLSDKELAEKAEDAIVFAKINPLQKARIIKALKTKSHTVGFIGDGVNDAVAMKEADVSISVDTAVDIAKESADIILLKSDLTVLEQGVLEGRNIFGNIMKYIKMTTSSNFGNMFSVLIASAFLPFLPMLPIQILVQNLLYDFSQLSIPLDNMDHEFLDKPRKWEATGIARFMAFIGPISSIFDIVTFLILWFVFAANVPAMQSLFQSGWFIEGLLSQTLIVHMIRTQKIPFIQSRASAPVLVWTATIMAIGIAIPFTGVGKILGMQALPLDYFPILAAILLGYCILTQLVKMWYIRRFNVWLE